MRFIDEHMRAFAAPENPNAVLIVCNQGGSRAPTLAMLYLAARLPASFAAAEEQFAASYPAYQPGTGMREFARTHWAGYRAMGESWLEGAPRIISAEAAALDKAEQIWQRFCEHMKSDPALARDQLLKSLVQALTTAGTQSEDRLHHGRQDPGD
jgi:hypothetical protein